MCTNATLPDKREAGIKFLPGPYVLVTPSLEVLGENTELLRHREGVASSEEFAFVRVRLAAEVAPQLDRAKRELVRIQRIARREHDLKVVLTKHHKVKWQRSLRALDAHGVSASWAALGRVLFPKLSDEHPDFMARRSAERAYKQAMRISEGAYRSLIP